MDKRAQSVVYRHYKDLEPPWQYHSMPESVVGGASTLESARSDYRDALRFSLETETLPKISEYVEYHVPGFGVWVRLPRQQTARHDVIAQVVAQLRPEDRDWFAAHPTAGGDPVILPGDPDQTIAYVLDQITPFDSIILMMVHREKSANLQTVWLVVSGKVTDDEDDAPLTSFESLGLTPESSLRDLATVAVTQHVSRLTLA